MSGDVLTPARRRGIEMLDDPNIDPAVRERSIGDVTRANRWLGGLRAASIEVRDALRGRRRARRCSTSAPGLGDIPRVRRRRGVALRSRTRSASTKHRRCSSPRGSRMTYGVCANALTLPFRDRSVDVVMCSQVLHHFDHADAERLVSELHRVARIAVIISDLRRSWIAAAGFWMVSFPMRFHRVTRHDGTVSVLRGFTAAELRDIVRSATGVAPLVRHRLGWRLTARWSPIGAE